MRLAYRLAFGLAGVLDTATKRARVFVRFAGETGGQGLNAGQRGAGFFARLRRAAGDQAEAMRGRPRRGLTWPLRSLPGAALAFHALSLAFAAWQNFSLVQVQSEQRVMSEAGQLHEHAISALETYALVLAWINDRIRGLDWDRIEHDDGLHRFLSDIETLPQIGTVSIIDATGYIRASGRSFPSPNADGSNRATFWGGKAP